MKKQFLAFIMAISVIISANAQSSCFRAPHKHPGMNGFTELFKPDLSNAVFPAGVWTTADGVITADKDEFIWTNKIYDNFILDLEFKTADGTNSGVVVYCSDLDNWVSHSVEIQIADDFSKKWSESPASWQCGAIFGHLPASESRVFKPGEWNHMTITCMDELIYVVLNGKRVTFMDMKLWTSATVNPDGSEIPSWLSTPFAELERKGYIGFQGKHAGAPIWFRNIKIKEL